MSIPPIGSAVITPETMYAEIQSTRRAVDRLVVLTETSIDRHQDHEKRIRALEKKLWAAAGAGGCLGAAAGIIATIFGG